MLLLTHSDNKTIGGRFAADLAEVEDRFAAELISDLPCVNALVSHVEQYRGKMLRPMLVLAAGMASTGDDRELTDAHRVVATVVEMVHMATLVHDDILDEAQVRRRGVTINHLQGNEAAVMLGDYLISHAYHLCSSLENTVANQLIAETTNTVCEGELLQLTNCDNVSLDERTYFEIVRRKTGSLCGSCCRIGAVLSDVSPEVADGMYDYGERLGVAFQIIDDLLDLIGTEDTVGKSLGRDLQKGKFTLPLIHCLRSSDESQRRQLLNLLQPPGQERASTPARGSAPAIDSDRLVLIRRLMTASGSVEYANQWAARLIEQAKSTLDALSPSPARAFLLSMADAVLTREF